MFSKKGFTLIELLVVIAIIAILAAILFPVFLSAKAKARTMKCLAHGRELGQATLMYLSDNSDRMPAAIDAWPEPARTEAKNYLNSITWYYLWSPGWNATWRGGATRYIYLKKYVKNDDIYICPDPNTMYAKRYAYGYRMSWNMREADNFVNGDRGFHGPDGLGRTLAEVQDLDRQGGIQDGKATPGRYMPPSKKIVWMCYALGRWACNGKVGTGSYPWVFPSYAHQDGSVFVYADGHAQFHRMGRGWAPLKYTTLPIDATQ